MKPSKYIDHTLLKADAAEADIKKLCREAAAFDFASVCINSCWIETACSELAGSTVKVCTVIGFPLGAMSTAAKVFEAGDAVARGADEVDMVLNIGWLKDGQTDAVRNEISAVKKAVGDHILKVIIETCLLSKEEKIAACRAVTEAGADFIKTSTGFSKAGATVEDVALLRANVGPEVKVKAAGGIRTPEDFRRMIEAGADRIGTSNGVVLLG